MVSISEKCHIGIDIGGTKLRVALVDSEFAIKDIFTTREHYSLSPEAVINIIADSVNKLINRNENVELKAVGAGFPGPVNKNAGAPFSYTNLFNNWGDVSLADLIEDKLGLPTFIDNDANLAGMAEMRFGAGKNHSDAVYLTISTGIGGAIFVNNQIVRGHMGRAGEFGHMIVNLEGKKCKCGNRGCFMGEFSGIALESFLENHPDLLDYLSEKNPRVGVKKLFQNAIKGDEKALQVVKSFEKYINVSLHNIVQLLNPELIIIGGGIGKSFKELYLEGVYRYFEEYLPETIVQNTVFKEAEFRDTNGIIGAALLADENLNS